MTFVRLIYIHVGMSGNTYHSHIPPTHTPNYIPTHPPLPPTPNTHPYHLPQYPPLTPTPTTYTQYPTLPPTPTTNTHPYHPPPPRTRVGKGKRVGHRVESGGRPILKKKKKTETLSTHAARLQLAQQQIPIHDTRTISRRQRYDLT